MKLADLYETPQTIDFGLTDIEKNTDMAKYILNFRKKHKLQLIKQYSPVVGLFSFPQGIAMIDESKIRVLYIVQYSIEYIKIIKTNTITQVAVWSDRSRFETKGLPEYIFFHILLPKTSAIMADSKQTWKGQDFWLRSISSALVYSSLYVYYIDFLQNTIVPVTSNDEFEKICKTTQPWGNDIKHRKQRFIISDKLL